MSSALGNIIQHAAAANGRLKAGAGALLPNAVTTKKSNGRRSRAKCKEEADGDLDEEDEVYDELTSSPPPSNCCFGLASSAASLPTSASRLASSLSCLADYQRKSKLAAEEEIEAAKIIERLDDIRKPKNDPHSYRFIQLENGIRLLLVSTALPPARVNGRNGSQKSSTSAAALDVRVGSFNDPVSLQGLCHLCEHVLFTGSETYPNESYGAFLGSRGGSSNAYTASEHTNFHFDVPSVHFMDALSRFVSFFVCPIFRESSVQAELEIIHSEHEKNRFNDLWRTNQVERALAHENHPFSKFSTGTRETLEVDPTPTSADSPKRNLRYELYNFWKHNYSANLMCACLVHDESLDRMEEIAKEHFLAIANKNIPERIWPSKPFRSSQMRIMIHVVPVKDIYHANLTFPMEDFHEHFAAGPCGYVAQLIGHKGPKGLFAQLRAQGLAHHLVAGKKTLARGFSFFVITVQMTEEGERRVEEVVKSVFQYIQLLRERGPQRWFFDEIRFLSEQQFEQKDAERPQEFASNASNWLDLYPPRDVLSAEYIYSAWRPDIIRRVLKGFDPICLPELFLLLDRIRFKSWYLPATQYKLAKAHINVQFSCPELASLDARSSVLNNLFTFMIRDALTEYSYLGQMAGLFYSLKPNKMGVELSIRGYSENQDIYLSNILSVIYGENTFSNEDRFEDVYEMHKKGIESSEADPLKSQVKFLLCSILCPRTFLRRERMKALSGITLGDISEYAEAFLTRHSTEVFFYGNLTLKQADAMSTSVIEARKDYLERIAFKRGVVTERNEHLEEWFVANPAERIVALEKALFDGGDRDPDRREGGEELEKTLSVIVEEGEGGDADADRGGRPQVEFAWVDKTRETTTPSPSGERDREKSPSTGADIAEPALAKMCRPNQELRIMAANSENVFIVHNEVQSSSCVLFYLQCGLNTPSTCAVLELFFSLVRAQLDHAMKHVVQLGYVVCCDIRKVNGTLGFRVIVESQYPLSFVIDTVESALDGLDQFLADQADSGVVDVAKAALAGSNDEEAERRFRDNANTTWREIIDGAYVFRRKDLLNEALDQTSAYDVIHFYRDHIKKGARYRRQLIVSIGPDPTVNDIEGVDCLVLDRMPEFQNKCKVYPAVPKNVMAEWYTGVFSAKNNIYAHPEVPDLSDEEIEDPEQTNISSEG